MFRRKLILNNKKGITLIALIITIIVLLILAGVALNFVLGENGILRHAEFAKEKYENKAQIEQNELAQLDDYISNGRDTITISKEEYNILKNNMNFSTEEKVVGTWIDGKPLYQKTILYTGTINANGEATISSTVSNIDNVVLIEGTSYRTSGNYTYYCNISEAQSSNQLVNVYYEKFQNIFHIHCVATYSDTTYQITFKYTKTTDTATNN